MSDMITAEEAGKLLDGTTPGPWRYRPHKHDDWGVVRGGVFNEDWGGYPHLAQVRDPDKLDDPILNAHRASGKDPWEANARLTAAAPDLARTVIALHAQLADAKAAQAMVVERAAACCPQDNTEQHLILALADTDGLALVQSLRAERDEAQGLIYAARLERNAAEDQEKELAEELRAVRADRDRLAAANAALEAQVARLVGALCKHHNWHLSQDREGDAWGIDPVDAYSESGLCEDTVAALAEVQADARREGA